MHASFLESLLLATFGDVLNQQVLPKLSQQLAAELKIPDTGCTQWLQLAEHRKQWTSLVRDCNRRLILHPMASQEPATAESEFYTASAPSAVELAFTVAEGILDDCSTELEQHQAGEIPAEQLIAAIANAIPAFNPNDASIVYARLEREFVILSAGTEPDVTIQMLMDHAGCSRTPIGKALEGETLTKELRGKPEWFVYAELLPLLKAKSNTAKFHWPSSVAGLKKKTAKNSK